MAAAMFTTRFMHNNNNTSCFFTIKAPTSTKQHANSPLILFGQQNVMQIKHLRAVSRWSSCYSTVFLSCGISVVLKLLHFCICFAFLLCHVLSNWKKCWFACAHNVFAEFCFVFVFSKCCPCFVIVKTIPSFACVLSCSAYSSRPLICVKCDIIAMVALRFSSILQPNQKNTPFIP